GDYATYQLLLRDRVELDRIQRLQDLLPHGYAAGLSQNALRLPPGELERWPHIKNLVNDNKKVTS
ncbi:hypothetical protein DRH14_01730, partial [Candidatus Shapirobacteria bacterium]